MILSGTLRQVESVTRMRNAFDVDVFEKSVHILLKISL